MALPGAAGELRDPARKRRRRALARRQRRVRRIRFLEPMTAAILSGHRRIRPTAWRAAQIGPIQAEEQPDRRAHGGRDRSAVPPAVQEQLGAGMAVSEMVASNSLLWGSEKTIRRGNHEGEVEPIQIAGADPAMMAEAAQIQRRSRRAHHRHQHGLPGQEDLQRDGRFGAAAEMNRWWRASSRRWSRR